MQNPFLTVIIPSFNRSDVLNECLRHLSKQTLQQENFEIIVVDDGSKDDTQVVLKKWKKILNNLKSFKQKNSGQAKARNRAIQHAKGKVVLFIGDDMYANINLLKEHVDFHKDHPSKKYACLGLTEWDERKSVSDYMRWLTDGGPQFAYKKLKAGSEARFWYFYTSNISLKLELLQKEKFDDDFKGYGWEDIELAYRLSKNENMKIIYEPKALVRHDHFMDLSSLEKRMLSIGGNTHIFEAKHPELKVVPRGIKRFILSLIGAKPISITLKLFSKRLYWYSLSKRYFMKGVRSV